MQKSETPDQDEVQTKCKDCKRSLEHFSAVLPFTVLEKIVDKPLKIRGIAMTAGMSRNFNIYTPEELQGFASKLVNSPVYIEHVSVDKAIGKVTKTDWDGHALWYEAEIYESDVADKIRKGLVQHVSVGADYEAIDVVDGKVPHGLHNAELSLVAVPGIPETNVQVLEKLSTAGASAGQGTPRGVESLNEEELKALVEAKVQEAIGKTAEASEVKKLTEEVEGLRKKLAETESKLADAQKLLEQKPPSSLVKDPPKTVPISEAITILEGLLPSPAVERSTLGMQRECQEIRSAIYKLQERSKARGD
jgi:hypothetical protein